MTRVRVSKLLALLGGDRRRGWLRTKPPASSEGAVLGARDHVNVYADPTHLSWHELTFTLTLELPRLMAHAKVSGVVCSHGEDGSRDPTVFARLGDVARGLHSVGRLDAASEGLLILTDDGALSQRLTHPRFAVPRTYVVGLARAADEQALAALRAGRLALRDGHRPHPSILEEIPPDDALLACPRWPFTGAQQWWRVGLNEGKYHEVRRMFAACGSHVVALRRIAYGGVSLPADTEPGALWSLSDVQREALYAQVGLRPALSRVVLRCGTRGDIVGVVEA